MSFSKARLRRFNEEIPQVPSPGRYDPKLDASVKGAVMPTSKRFPGQTSSTSLDNLDKVSTASSDVVFRTPQVMRKVPLTPRIQYLKEKNFDTSGSDILSSEERSTFKMGLKKTVSKADYRRLEDELHSLENEHKNMCLDKDTEINILKREIEEIKLHEAELKDILEEKNKLASDRHQEAFQLKENLETMVQKIKVDREEHQRFINDLNSRILELQNNKYELETVLAEKQSVIVTINDKYSDLENDLKLLQEENLHLAKANSCILMGTKETLQLLDEKMNSQLQNLQKKFDLKYEEDQQRFQTKMNYLNYLAHEFNLKTQEVIDKLKQSQEKVTDLERLIDKKIKEFSEYIKDADERCKYLYRELRKVEDEREELVESDLEKKLVIIETQEKSDTYKSELDQCRNRCKKYQVTLNTMNETVRALSNRLLESEQEVERLNEVEKDLETQRRLLEEKAQHLLDNIVNLREGMDRMEEEIIRDVSGLKKYLEAKADLFKEEAVKTEQTLNNKIYEKQCAIDILLQENDYFKNEIEKKDNIIEDYIKRERKHEENIVRLKGEQSKLEEELSEKLSAQKNLYKILNDKLERTNSLVQDLQHEKLKQESRIMILVEQEEGYKSTELSLKKIISEQTGVIQALQIEVERKKKIEIDQKQCIDEMVSELALEKERNDAMEAEKDKIKDRLHNAELIVEMKSEKVDELLSHIESLKQSLKNSEEKIRVTVDEKMMLEKLTSDLQSQLRCAKDKNKVEIPKLERDNINKAQNILDLNLSIDNLKVEIDLLKTNVSCLKAEKDSLNNVLEESKSTILHLKKTIEGKNLKINALNDENIRKNTLCEDLSSQLDKLSFAYQKQNQEMKNNTENCIALIEAEEKISDLESQLLQKDNELELLAQRVNEAPQLEDVSQLRDELKELKTKYETVKEEKDRLTQEVADLMGHQNIQQKIKHVSDLKQHYSKLTTENDSLRLEVARLKTKIDNMKKQSENNKENVSVLRKEEKQKMPGSATKMPGSATKGSKTGSVKKPMSPGVLKPSNH